MVPFVVTSAFAEVCALHSRVGNRGRALLIARRLSPVACRLSPVAAAAVACRRARHQSSERECSPSSQLQVRSCARDFPLARSTKCAGSEREETFGVVHSFVPPRPPFFFPNSHPSFSSLLISSHPISSLLFSSLLFALLSRASIPAPKFRPFRPFFTPSFLLSSNETSRLHTGR